ncbi:MAG: Eco57I restriction-modification methylase domain-containing protein, partial [Nitrososphaera sp.]
LNQKSLGLQISRSGKYIIYHTRKLRYFLQFLDVPPKIIHEDGNNRPTSELKAIRFNNEYDRDVALATYCSSLFFWYYIAYSDCRNLNKREVHSFPLTLAEMDASIKKRLGNLSKVLMMNLRNNSEMKMLRYKKYGDLNVQVFKPRLTKGIIDEIDIELSKHYGFTKDETSFILNYDLRFRMGADE